MAGTEAEVSERTLDESPDAYKDPMDVLLQQLKSIKVVDYIRTIINVKG